MSTQTDPHKHLDLDVFPSIFIHPNHLSSSDLELVHKDFNPCILTNGRMALLYIDCDMAEVRRNGFSEEFIEMIQLIYCEWKFVYVVIDPDCIESEHLPIRHDR